MPTRETWTVREGEGSRPHWNVVDNATGRIRATVYDSMDTALKFAAAADLLAALTGCLDALDELAESGPEPYRNCCPATRAAARAAIKRAEGK